MKPQIEKVSVCERVYLGECRTVADIQLVAKECEKVTVLCLSADAVVLNLESLSGEVLFDGKVFAKAVVKDDDGNLASLNYGVDFADKFVCNNVRADVKAETFCQVEDVSFRVESNVIYAKCVLITKFFGFLFDEHDLLVDCDGLQTKTQNAVFCSQKVVAKKDFSVVDEVELRHDITKILLAKTNGVVSGVKCEDDVVTVKGDFFTCVTYIRDDNDICSTIVQTPFEEEISAPGSDKDSVCLASLQQKGTRVSMELSQDRTKEFSMEISAQLCLSVFKNQNTTFVQDAFSMDYNVDLQTKNLQTCLPKEYVTHTCVADGVVEVQGVDEILCITNPKVQMASQTFSNGTYDLRGIVCADLFFVSEEKVLSTSVEIPFETKIETGSNFACELSAVCVTQIYAKVVRGAVSVEAGLKFGAKCFDIEKCVAICNATLLDKKVDDGCAIEVLTGKKGMTLWDVQKYLGMSQQDLLVCNPDLLLPLQQDKKIVVYRKIK